jgi:hypothetical protein
MGMQFLLSSEGKHLREQLVMALTEGDRLHVEEVQKLWSLVKEEMVPSRIVNMAIGAIGEYSTATVSAWFSSLTGTAYSNK